MTGSEVTLRQVRFEDLTKICKWTTDEEWNIPLTEYEIMFKYCHDNWICVEVDGHMAGIHDYYNRAPSFYKISLYLQLVY